MKSSLLVLLNRKLSLPSGAVAVYDFAQGSNSQTLYDRSGHGNDGTLGSTGSVEASDPTWGTNTLTASGTQFVSTPVTPTLQGTKMVVFKPTTVDASVRHVFSSHDGSSGRSYLAHQNAHLLLGVGSAAPAGAATLVSGTWYCAAHVWDGTRNRAYLNGVVDLDAAQSGVPNTTIPFCLEGINTNGTKSGGFVGSTGYALYWNRALSAGEVHNSYLYLRSVMASRGVRI